MPVTPTLGAEKASGRAALVLSMLTWGPMVLGP